MTESPPQPPRKPLQQPPDVPIQQQPVQQKRMKLQVCRHKDLTCGTGGLGYASPHSPLARVYYNICPVFVCKSNTSPNS